MRRCASKGFTILEMMMVVVIVVILTSITIPLFRGAKERAYDAAVVSDFHRAFNAIEGHFAVTMGYPASPEEAEFIPSEGVVFTRWSIEQYDGRPAMHLDASHANVSHQFHNLGFPYNTQIERGMESEPETLALFIPTEGSRAGFDLRALALGVPVGPS